MRDERECGSSDRLETTPVERGGPPIRSAVVARLRADLTLWTPFLVASCLLLIIDLWRQHDSIPTVTGVEESTIHISYSVFPRGTATIHRPLGALVDLQEPLFWYALGLEVIEVAAIAVAGWLTMTRASDEPFRPNRFLVYVSSVFLFDLLFRVVDASGVEYTGGRLLVELTILALVMGTFVRLFLVPVTMLREGGIVRPVTASWRYSRRHGLTLFGVIVVVDIGSWTLAQAPTLVRVPELGTVLSTTIAGTVHAVSLVVLYEQCTDAQRGVSRS